MNNQLKSIVIIFLAVAAIIGFFWIANFLGSGEKTQSEKPLVICQPQNAPPEKQRCNWTTHIHATVKVFKNGTEILVRFEEGKLEGQHTHSEPNKLHWHGLIPVDPKTKEVADWSALEVQKIVADFKFSQEGTPKFIVNGKEVEPSYIWKDGDVIEIHYE
ncbi:MAG: hypothetical protein HYS15_02310 [Candidatus Spechtbacteria bacterium]|nr:hypothetical protein [Candidatus Spechtbacteria bacterium]